MEDLGNTPLGPERKVVPVDCANQTPQIAELNPITDSGPEERELLQPIRTPALRPQRWIHFSEMHLQEEGADGEAQRWIR